MHFCITAHKQEWTLYRGSIHQHLQSGWFNKAVRCKCHLIQHTAITQYTTIPYRLTVSPSCLHRAAAWSPFWRASSSPHRISTQLQNARLPEIPSAHLQLTAWNPFCSPPANSRTCFKTSNQSAAKRATDLLQEKKKVVTIFCHLINLWVFIFNLKLRLLFFLIVCGVFCSVLSYFFFPHSLSVTQWPTESTAMVLQTALGNFSFCSKLSK